MPIPLRLALVGCGTIAPTHVQAINALGADTAVLRVCCDIDPECLARFSQLHSLHTKLFSEILDDQNIDAVALCVPSGLHAELGIQALRAGKHVLVEKPMDITMDACGRLEEAADISGKTLSVICQHRFDPASKTARQVVDSGRLGKIVLVDTQICWYRSQDYYDSAGWRGTWEMDGGGCLMNQGVHTIDLMRWLAGPVETVYAQTRTAAHERIVVEDVVSATVTLKNGGIGTITASTSSFPGFPARLALYGTHGSLVIEGDALRTLAVQGEEQASEEAPSASAVRVASGGTRSVIPAALDWGEAHLEQYRDFVKCTQTGEKPLVNASEARAAVAVILAVYESSRTGKVISMAEFDKAGE